MSRRARRAGHREDGTILILSIGFCVLALLLIFAVIDASAVFVARRDLAAAVDGTALAAAQQVDVAGVYAGGADTDLPLDRQAVGAEIDRYVAATYPIADHPGWRISGGVSGDRRAVVVEGSRTVRLPAWVGSR